MEDGSGGIKQTKVTAQREVHLTEVNNITEYIPKGSVRATRGMLIVLACIFAHLQEVTQMTRVNRWPRFITHLRGGRSVHVGWRTTVVNPN